VYFFHNNLTPVTKNAFCRITFMRKPLQVLFLGILINVSLPQGLSAAIPYTVKAQLPTERDGQVLIYGAYGFSGSEISRLAESYGITPVLAGRNPEKLNVLAQELGLAQVPLTLDNHKDLVEVLRHFELVMNIAGPYTFTAEPMLNAAAEAGTHYVDLTGENHVIEEQWARDKEFREANIMVMPAVGYDVVPTDSLNLYVAERVEDPTNLMLVMGAYKSAEGAQTSRGTIKSGLEMLSRPLKMRIVLGEHRGSDYRGLSAGRRDARFDNLVDPAGMGQKIARLVGG
jgi:short subunit dehydrogenase-like uncharacterized protein